MSSNASDYFEIATESGLLRKGEKVPGTFDIPSEAGTPVVESLKETGDWIDIQLSGGFTISLPESRIAYIVTRDAA